MADEAPRILVEGGPVERRVNHALAAIVGLIVGSAIALGVTLELIHQTSVNNCREIEAVKTSLRETVRESERLILSSPIRSPSEKLATVVFYRDALGRLKPHHC